MPRVVPRRDHRTNRQEARARREKALTRRNNVMKVGTVCRLDSPFVCRQIDVHTYRDLPMQREAEPSEYARYAWRTTPPHARTYEHTQ